MQIIERFSGIISMLVAWLFVVAPALKFGINVKSDTITTSTRKNATVKRVISYGLIIGAIFQALFLSYLVRRFSISFFDFGSLLYLSASLATLLIGLSLQSKHTRSHKILAFYYWIACPLSLLFIGISAESTNSYPLIISIIMPVLYFIGQGILLKKYGGRALGEFWAFFVLSIWTAVMTFI